MSAVQQKSTKIYPLGAIVLDLSDFGAVLQEAIFNDFSGSNEIDKNVK
jgi:hypothetical protein